MQNQHQPNAHDPDNMLGHVLAWPKLLELGWEAGGLPAEQQASLKAKRQIVCCGMGGSAIGAGIVGDYVADQLEVPYLVVRDYDLPPFVNEDTLVLCLSYSGGTEETLSAYAQAKQRGAAVVAVATGGALLTQAAADKVPALQFEYAAQPRVSLPITIGLLLRLFGELGYVPDQAAAVKAAGATLAGIAHASQRDPSAAKALATELAGMVPIVYGAGFLAEAARRLKGETNENSKQTAGWEVLPEQNHNALVGYEFPADIAEHVRFVLLRSELEHPRHGLRFEVTKDLLSQRGLPYSEVRGQGSDKLSQLLSVIFQGDLATVYLAYLNGADPTPVEVINGLKARLAEAS